MIFRGDHQGEVAPDCQVCFWLRRQKQSQKGQQFSSDNRKPNLSSNTFVFIRWLVSTRQISWSLATGFFFAVVRRCLLRQALEMFKIFKSGFFAPGGRALSQHRLWDDDRGQHLHADRLQSAAVWRDGIIMSLSASNISWHETSGDAQLVWQHHRQPGSRSCRRCWTCSWRHLLFRSRRLWARGEAHFWYGHRLN